jgi:DNA-binding response OmpR family regulator
MEKILVCDDDLLMLKAIEFKLKREMYEIVTAKDGKEAINLIETERPDIIITDLLMPFVSGLELIEYVRSNLKITTPIVVLSKVGLEETVLKAFDLGADDYVVKPFSPNELSIRIKKLLLRK